jgi:hypothetical protein
VTAKLTPALEAVSQAQCIFEENRALWLTTARLLVGAAGQSTETSKLQTTRLEALSQLPY